MYILLYAIYIYSQFFIHPTMQCNESNVTSCILHLHQRNPEKNVEV